MNKKRKVSVITILLCFVLVFSLMTISASAASKSSSMIHPEIGSLQQLKSPNPSVFVKWNSARSYGPRPIAPLVGYKVYWKTSKDKNFTSSKSLPLSQTSLTVQGLKIYETYTFKVLALFGSSTSSPYATESGKERKIKIQPGPTALSFRGNFKLTYVAASLGRLWVKWSPATFDGAAKQSGYELTYQIHDEKTQKVTKVTMLNGNKVLSFQREILKKAGQQAIIKVTVRPFAVNKYTGKLYTGPEVKKTVKNSLADF
jgi:hypothetical protein